MVAEREVLGITPQGGVSRYGDTLLQFYKESLAVSSIDQLQH